MEHYQNILTNHRMKVKFVKKREPFEFGHGPTQFSDHHAYMPVCFDGSSSTTCLLGAYVIPNTNDIPFLGSHSLMQKLQMVLDLPNNKVRIGSLRCEVEMHMVNGHLALKIDHTPKGSCHESVWKTLSMLSDQPEADAELVAPPKPSLLEHKAEFPADQLTDAEPVSTPAMVGQLEAPGEAVLSCRDVSGDDNAAGHQTTPSMDMEHQMALMEKAEGPCHHEKIQRSGNKHGRYAKCLDCLMTWQWDEEKQKWASKVSQKQQSLPLPSSSTAEVFLEKNHRPGWAMKALKGPMFPLGESLTSSPSTTSTKKLEKLQAARPKRSAAKRNMQEAEEEDYDWDLVEA